MIRYYRAFLPLTPEIRGICGKDHCSRTEPSRCFLCSGAGRWHRDETRRWLGYIVNMAINRKAGIPDEGRRKRDPDYQIRLLRDCVYIRNWLNHRQRFVLAGDARNAQAIWPPGRQIRRLSFSCRATKTIRPRIPALRWFFCSVTSNRSAEPS